MDIYALEAEVAEELAPLLDAMVWAEEEIATAQRTDPAAAGRVGGAFLLLRPTHPMMSTEVVFRSHCRELLRRVADCQDTRPGTAAECCAALSATSLRVPLSTGAAGLYARVWKLADLPPVELAAASVHYEALEGAQIDEHEAWLRRKLSQPWRVASQF